MARRPGPSLRALLFGCGGGAVLSQTATFLAGSESNVRQWGPWPAGPVRPSGPCCFGVASAPCVSLGGWKTGRGGRGPHVRSVLQGPAVWLWQRRRFRSDSYFSWVGSESNVRQWGPWPAGPVRPSGPCCFGVASAPCVSLGGWKTGRGGRGPQARSVPQDRAVLAWQSRRVWALAAGRQVRQLAFL